MDPRSGVANPSAPCRCDNQVNLNVARGYVHPERLQLATHARTHIREIRELIDFVEVFRRHPRYAAPDFSARLDAVLTGAGA